MLGEAFSGDIDNDGGPLQTQDPLLVHTVGLDKSGGNIGDDPDP